MGIFDKAKDLAGAHQEQADSLVDRAGDMLDERTGGKYAGQVDQGQEFVRGQYGDPRGEEARAPEAPVGEQSPTPEAPMGEGQPSVPEGEQPPAEAPPAPEAPLGEEQPPA